MSKISTGTLFLDNFLEGGYETDAITTIYGPPGSGKTTLILLSCISNALKGKKIIYVDTDGSFSIERLRQLTLKYQEVLSKIVFIKPANIEEQNKIFEQIKKTSKYDLLFIDAIATLYRLKRIRETVKEANNILTIQINDLLEITRKNNIPVIITNQVYTEFETSTTRMLGGDIIAYASKCILELQNYHKNRRKIILKKHRSIAGEKELYFQITQNGVEEV